MNDFYGNCHLVFIFILLSQICDFLFYSDDANDYIGKWSEQFEQIRSFYWISLKIMPTWNVVKETMNKISESVDDFDLNENASKVFTQFGFIKSYCTSEKFARWKDAKLSTELRWVEIFTHMDSNQVPYLEFSHLVEYILCLPGTNAPVERVFSSLKHMWKPECSSMNEQTLRAMLFVKNNMEYKCVDFYKYLKETPRLLRQIAS